MVKVASYSKTGTKKETDAALDQAVFGAEPNHELLSQAYRAYLANGRLASATTLTRGLVRGGGRKPWRQKGTGRARVGSIRVPNWRGGGVIFGPSGNENYVINMPIKAKRAAIRQALSSQAAEKRLVMIEDFAAGDGKTKTTKNLLAKLKLEGSVLLLVAEKTPEIDRATRNLTGLIVSSAQYANVFDILNADWIIMTAPAATQISQWLGEATSEQRSTKNDEAELKAEAKPKRSSSNVNRSSKTEAAK